MNSRLFQIVAGVIFIVSVGIYKIAGYVKQQNFYEQVIIQGEKRIALDLPRLDLSNSFLKHSGNSAAIKGYIERLNSAIPSREIWVNAIGDTAIVVEPVETVKRIEKQLITSDNSISVVFYVESKLWQLSDLFVFLILAMFSSGFGLWAVSISKAQQGAIKVLKTAELRTVPDPLKLIIDLNTKTLANSYHQTASVALANKPLCFYLALIEFCIENPDIVLNQNKNVPEELLEIANKYFYRLIDLGHTIRKRPNFSNSLEKTLSEIRAALDDVLAEHPDSKEVYYPPKAHGEGSRSRLHSYGLVNINATDIEVIGK